MSERVPITAGGLTRMDEMAAGIVNYLDICDTPEKCEEYFREFSAYVHDELFINFGICLSYDLWVVSDKIGDFGWGEWMNIADAYADIEMK